MRHFALLTLTLMVLAPSAFAAGADSPRILITPLNVSQRLLDEEPDVGSSVSDLLRDLLHERFRFPDMATVLQASEDTGLPLTLLYEDPDGCARLARAAGAHLVISGQLHSFGQNVVLSLRLFEIPKEGPARSKALVLRECNGLEGLPGSLPRVLKELGLAAKPPEKRLGAGDGMRSRAKPGAAPKNVDLPKLLAGLKSSDAGVRFASAVELGRAGKQEAVGPLMKVAAGDTDLFVRRAAARSLGELGNEQAVPTLIDMLGDQDYFVAIAANQAIIAITRHDCGLREGLTGGDVEKIVREAHKWWKSQED